MGRLSNSFIHTSTSMASEWQLAHNNNINGSGNGMQSSNNLPKFSDTFMDNSSGSSNGWPSSNSSSSNSVVLEKRLDWDRLVDKVFREETGRPGGPGGQNI